MDRNSLTRLLLFAAIAIGGYYFFYGKKAGEHPQQIPQEHYVDAPGFAPDVVDGTAGGPRLADPPAGTLCTLHGNRFEAELSTRGAGITHFYLTDPRYSESDGRDVSTTPLIERWRNLRTLFRVPSDAPSPTDQIAFDRFDWKLDASSGASGGKSCRFTYEDATAKVEKTVTVGERPFEVEVETTLTNLADTARKHTASIEAFAFRSNPQVKGKLGRVSPFLTSLECARTDELKRLAKDASEFKTGWFSMPLDDRYAAISNYYFAQALVPLDAGQGAAAGDKPSCDVLAEQWFGAGQHPDDEVDDVGAIYHARLQYPPHTLAPHESATYRQTAYFGPKERDVLSKAAGGGPRLQDLINLGTFSIVAKELVAVITWIHGNITGGNWGLSIIVLTIGLRIALFPLTWKQIQSTIAMRRLKPEMDALNARFKDDAQSKNVAMMELYKKNKVNPLGGCLPALVQMPIWFALYATLQTAVEFYHTKFLWFADLSAPDKFFVLPFVLGAAMIVQQRIVPQQGMDPVQAKMMMWLMPGVFTVMMLFLPAALGVYMLTNSVLGITQQLGVEKLFPRGPGSAITVSSSEQGAENKGRGTVSRGQGKGKNS